MNARKWRSVALLVAINLGLAAGLTEIALRVQQALGPIYDLAVGANTIGIGLSDTLNHVHAPHLDWDANGIQAMDRPNAPGCAPKILFMGDSFMDGLGRNETIPVYVRDDAARAWHKRICVFNVGTSSYAPSIYVPQAKQAIPIVKPDYVAIDIDETDLFDDYYRYRTLSVRDAQGSIVAVRPTPIFVAFHEGLVAATSKPLYLQRLIAKLYFTRVTYPRLLAAYNARRPADIFWASRMPEAEARAKYPAAIAYFHRTLEDLTVTAIGLMGSPDRLIYLHHPHLEHLASTGIPFNTIVSDTIAEVARAHGVRYFDATAELKREFGATPEAYYAPNDMHFNKTGLHAYADTVARYLGTALGWVPAAGTSAPAR